MLAWDYIVITKPMLLDIFPIASYAIYTTWYKFSLEENNYRLVKQYN